MTESAVGSPMLKARVPLVLDRPDETWFDIGLMHKDIRLAREVGDELATTAARQPLSRTRSSARPRTSATRDHDIAAVHRVLAELSAGEGAPM